MVIKERGIFDRLMFKMHYSKLLVKIRPSCFRTSWMQCLSKFFRKKLRVPSLVNPRAVEINIFADLTISKKQKIEFKRETKNKLRFRTDQVGTWGLLHLWPPSSTLSWNFTHLLKGLGHEIELNFVDQNEYFQVLLRNSTGFLIF